MKGGFKKKKEKKRRRRRRRREKKSRGRFSSLLSTKDVFDEEQLFVYVLLGNTLVSTYDPLPPYLVVRDSSNSLWEFEIKIPTLSYIHTPIKTYIPKL